MHLPQSNETYFNMWFNDDIKYNRRVGVELVLKPGTSPNEFTFDSKFDGENGLNPSIDDFYAPHDHIKYTEAAFPDPLEVPMFPKTNILNEFCASNVGQQRKLWHTTEIHTFFEYTKTEKFDFSGDDDVWVFINGKLAVDASGVHARLSQFIDLGRDAAAEHFNMTVGGIYTFDMFQAERQCKESNFKITTTLAAPCNAANVLNSKKQFDATVDLTPERAKTSRTVVVNDDGSFLLTAAGFPHSTSYLWVKEPVNVGTGFVINFDFHITDITEGFAFVLHRRREGLSNLPVSGGANLGFKGLKNSLAIVFDLCTDREEPGNSCKHQRVSIHTPDPGKGNSPSDRTLKVQDAVVLSLKNDEVHKVKLDYFAIPPALEVTIDGSLYLRLMPIDPIEIFQSRAAFAGFTGASGEFSNSNVTISNFKVFAVDVESSTTKTVDFPSDVTNFTRKFVLADGQEADGFSIQTFDGCDKAIAFGGRRENTRGIFVERIDPATGVYFNGSLTPKILEAEIEDRNTGTYKYTLRTLEEGRYSLFIYYGNPGIDCAFDFRNITRPAGSGTLVVMNVTTTGSPSCFFASIEDAIEMIPLTNAPTKSPTEFKPIIPVADETAGFVAGIGGGVVAVCAAIAAVLAIVYRRRWQKDKEFIEEGRGYKEQEALNDYDSNDQHGMVGRELLASRAAILRLRAHRGQDFEALSKLETEQEELLEEVSKMKKRIETRLLQVFGDDTGESIPKPVKRTPQKLEF